MQVVHRNKRYPFLKGSTATPYAMFRCYEEHIVKQQKRTGFQYWKNCTAFYGFSHDGIHIRIQMMVSVCKDNIFQLSEM
jgi:hypothetical protein